MAATLRENLLTANLFYNLSSAAISFSQALQQTALFLYVFLLNTPHSAFRFANFATQVPTACLSTQTIDYPTATEIRPCIVFSDSSSGQGPVKVRLRRTDGAGGTIFYEDPGGWLGLLDSLI